MRAHTKPSLFSRLKEPFSQGVIYSLAIHGVLMSVHFSAPEPFKLKPMDSRLEVILVNAESRARPVNPEVVAQVNMEAGGDRDKGRATSPLQAETKIENGQDIVRKTRKVADLEAMQRQLMAMARSPTTFVESQDTKKKSKESGADSEDIQFVIARLQAQIAKNISDYNKRPKRLTYGVNAVGANYARYVTDWAARIEELGTERYPRSARGKFYDSLVIMVEIQKDGHVGDIHIKRKSKYNVLNKAIKEIVLAGAPYEPFTKEMAAEGDILQIVRTWTFTNRSLQTSSAPAQSSVDNRTAPDPNSQLDRYCVIGNPIEHSRSPQIHTAFARQHHQAMQYTRLLAPTEGFEAAVRKFQAQSGRGMNVTVPFKEQAFKLADHCSARASTAGAANTLSFRSNGIHADNTDGVGLVRDLTRRHGLNLRGASIVLIGAGGAARGVLLPLMQAGAVSVLIANRTHNKALALVQAFAKLARENQVALAACEFAALAVSSSALIRPIWINATAAGLSGDSPVPGNLLAQALMAYDMVYAPEPTPFMAAASAAGCEQAADGLGMLVEQAAESFEIWRGVRPETDSVYRALR